MAKSIYIDFDGVLFDTLDMSWKATAEILFKYHVVPHYKDDSPLSRLPLRFYIECFWGRTWEYGVQAVCEYYHGSGINWDSFPISVKDLQKEKDQIVKANLTSNLAPVNTGALALLIFARVPVVFCTAGGPSMAMFKAKLVYEALDHVGALVSTSVVSGVDKTNPAFWKEREAEIVIDDDINVILAAEKAGHRTIHWREFLPKGI